MTVPAAEYADLTARVRKLEEVLVEGRGASVSAQDAEEGYADDEGVVNSPKKKKKKTSAKILGRCFNELTDPEKTARKILEVRA